MTAVGLGPGDEVLIPAHTYMATATSVLAVGAIPVIVDIDETHHHRSRARSRRRSARAPAPSCPVHMWGAACDMDAIMEIARAAQADRHRGRLPGRRRRLRGPQVRLDRPHRRLQLQLLQEHDLRARAAASPSTTTRRRAGALRHRPLPFLLARPQRRGEALRRQRRARLRADGRDAQRPARPPRRHDRGDARREASRSSPAPPRSAISACEPAPMNSPDHDCATQVMFTLPSAEAAERASSRSSRA